MASARAQEVAEILWELKREGKIATYSEIASRAGFTPGVDGRTMQTTLRTVRRDWPHLHWFRALPDGDPVELGTEQEELLVDAGILTGAGESPQGASLKDLEHHLLTWGLESDTPQDDQLNVIESRKMLTVAMTYSKRSP